VPASPPSFVLHPPSSPILLAGPTAVGKSTIALRLAQDLGGEIISVDSMQVYRGLDIGTAKPSPEERQRVPHHLVDILDLAESFDAVQFARRAHKAVAAIQSRGAVPILCGGTGLYFKAFLDGLEPRPHAAPAVRRELEARPRADLLRELEQKDPATFARIDHRNPRRVIRALEVIRLTGQPLSAQQPHPGSSAVPPLPSALDFAPPSTLASPPFFFFWRETNDLSQRISCRVDEMFRRGLVDETRGLLSRGLEQNQTALQAIGYRQVVEHLRGERALAETIERVKARTRQFARRQKTWFRGQTRAEWILLKPGQDLEATAERLGLAMRKATVPNPGCRRGLPSG
jgi:tRNA dimethylallyltransferase